jgi:hypothetical protein
MHTLRRANQCHSNVAACTAGARRQLLPPAPGQSVGQGRRSVGPGVLTTSAYFVLGDAAVAAPAPAFPGLPGEAAARQGEAGGAAAREGEAGGAAAREGEAGGAAAREGEAGATAMHWINCSMRF